MHCVHRIWLFGFLLSVFAAIAAASVAATPVQHESVAMTTITGVVRSAADPLQPDAIGRIRIYVWLASDDKLRARIDVGLELDTLPPAASPAADGTFEIPNLTPGLYRMRVSRLPKGWSAVSALAGASDLLKGPFEISSKTAALQNVVITVTDKRLQPPPKK